MAKNKGNNRGQDEFAKFARKTDETVEGAEGPQQPVQAAGTQVVSVDVSFEERVPEQVTHAAADSTEFEIDAEVADVVGNPPDVSHPVAEHVTFHTGRELPPVAPREGVHPLLVKSYKLFRTLTAGGLITPWAVMVREQVDAHMAELKREVEGG